MSNQPNRDLASQAELQHGAFTRAQANAVDISNDALGDRVRTGRYERIHPGVFVVAGSKDSIHRRISAAVRSVPSLSAASHQTAAELLGLTRRGFRSIEVVTTRWDRVRRPGIRVHESTDLIANDVTEHGGIPVTTPERTIVDLGASNRWIVEDALDEGLRRGLLQLDAVEALVKRVARRGRRGVGVIRPLLEARRRWETVTDSVLENRFRKLLADGYLPDPVGQYELRTAAGGFICRADFAYPESKILIELDGEAFHSDRESFRSDRRKQNKASLEGWLVLRYTWWDLEQRSGGVLAELAEALGGFG